jgi:hypothetical protein
LLANAIEILPTMREAADRIYEGVLTGIPEEQATTVKDMLAMALLQKS